MTVGSLTWDVARSGGLVAYALLTASVAMGLALSLGWRSPRWTRFVTNEVHRFVTLLALVFVAIHGIAIAVDPFIKMSVPDVLVPFLGSYRPVWVALGIVAAYLAVAVYLSERIRSRIGYAWWRRFHGFAFVAFALALVHGVATGSDTRTIWALALYAGSILLVGILLILRLFPEPPGRTRPVAASLAIIVAAGVVGFALVGPLQPGWSARAGGAIPAGVAAGATGSDGGAASGGSAAAPAQAGPGIKMSSPLLFTGTLSRSSSTIQVQGQTTDGTGAFLVQLVGRNGALASGQIVLQTGTGEVCQGDVGSVGDTTIDATCSTGDGSTWSLRVAITQAGRSAISGTLEVTPRSSGGQSGAIGAPGSGTASGRAGSGTAAGDAAG
jgi:DMSO/TMAO reductase YedYZ heme-binding membrane subunit